MPACDPLSNHAGSEVAREATSLCVEPPEGSPLKPEAAAAGKACRPEGRPPDPAVPHGEGSGIAMAILSASRPEPPEPPEP